MKKYRLHISLALVVFFITNGSLIAGGPNVYIELPGEKTEYCIGDRAALIGKCIFDADEFSRHKWESSSPGMILETRENMVFVELNETGEHQFTYNAWDDQGRKGSATITLKVYDIPDNEVVTSQPFFTSLFGRDLPKIIEAIDVNDNYLYQWYRDGNKIKEATKTKYKAEETGSYRLEITSSNGCKVYSQPIEIK